MTKKSNSIVKFSLSVLLLMLLLGTAAGTASAQNVNATIRAYGEDDIVPDMSCGLPDIYQKAVLNI